MRGVGGGRWETEGREGAGGRGGDNGIKKKVLGFEAASFRVVWFSPRGML